MAVAFLVLAVPGLALWGVDGFVVGPGRCVSLAMLVVRRALRAPRCCPACGSGRSACARSRPCSLGAAAALALRLALWGGERPLWQALCELALFLARDRARHAALERDLLREFTRYLRTGQPDAGRSVRIGLYDPHLATLGGGERYFLTVSRGGAAPAGMRRSF